MLAPVPADSISPSFLPTSVRIADMKVRDVYFLAVDRPVKYYMMRYMGRKETTDGMRYAFVPLSLPGDDEHCIFLHLDFCRFSNGARGYFVLESHGMIMMRRKSVLTFHPATILYNPRWSEWIKAEAAAKLLARTIVRKACDPHCAFGKRVILRRAGFDPELHAKFIVDFYPS